MCVGGVEGQCKKCRNEHVKRWKRNNRERLAARRRELYAVTNGARHKELERLRAERVPYRTSAESLLSGMRERRRKRNLPVAMEFRSKSFVENWLRKQPHCVCCGVRFALGPKGGIKCDASPSFDQIKAGGGYELNNTALICWRCNNIKRNYNAADLRMVASWIDRITVWGNETTKFKLQEAVA